MGHKQIVYRKKCVFRVICLYSAITVLNYSNVVSIIEIKAEVVINYNLIFTTYIAVDDIKNFNEELASFRHS
jgi:hypothetical protein